MFSFASLAAKEREKSVDHEHDEKGKAGGEKSKVILQDFCVGLHCCYLVDWRRLS